MKSELRWDLRPLYDGDDDPRIEADLSASELAYTRFADTWSDKLDSLSDPQTLVKALSDWEQLRADHNYHTKAGYYFSLRTAQEANNPTLRAKQGKVNDVATSNANMVRFFPLTLGALSQQAQSTALSSPELKRFRSYLRQLFAESKHYLEAGQETVFALLAEPAYGRWTEMIEGFLAKEARGLEVSGGKKVEVGYGEIDKYLTDSNPTVRQNAIKAADSILSSNVDAAENELNAILETKKVSDQLRGYALPEEERLLDDMIAPATVAAMITAVTSRYDISHRFYDLKAKLLGSRTLQYGERNVLVGSSSVKFTFEESHAIVGRALKSLDLEFTKHFEAFIANGQIDVYPRVGKRSGAFCAFDRADLPVYIMLNHTNSLRDLTTLAHEVGHGINDELVRVSQSPLLVGTPLSTAEVASTFMEDFALEEAARDLPEDERLNVLIAKLNDDIATIFRQVAAYGFEQKLHAAYRQHGYRSKEQIGEMFQDAMKSYLGDGVEMSEVSQNWWVGWHHFRRPFYVYSYASGLLISKALQDRVRRDSTEIQNVKKFLGSGLSRTAEEVFTNIGIDISEPGFWQQGLDRVEALLNEAEQLAEKIK